MSSTLYDRRIYYEYWLAFALVKTYSGLIELSRVICTSLNLHQIVVIWKIPPDILLNRHHPGHAFMESVAVVIISRFHLQPKTWQRYEEIKWIILVLAQLSLNLNFLYILFFVFLNLPFFAANMVLEHYIDMQEQHSAYGDVLRESEFIDRFMT